MDEVARIGGLLESGALEDAEIEGLYDEVLAAFPRALPTIWRMGYAQPKVPLERAAPVEEGLGPVGKPETGGPGMDEAERERRIIHPVRDDPGQEPASWPKLPLFTATSHRVKDVMGRYFGGAEIDELVEEFPGILPEQLEEYVRRRSEHHQGGLYEPEVEEIRRLAGEGLVRRPRSPAGRVSRVAACSGPSGGAGS